MKERINKKIISALKDKGLESHSDSLKKLANGLSEKDLQNEARLKELIQRISDVVRIPITAEKQEKILRYLRKYGSSPEDIKKFLQMFK